MKIELLRRKLFELTYMTRPLFKPASWFTDELAFCGRQTDDETVAAELDYFVGKGWVRVAFDSGNAKRYAIAAAGIDAWERGEA